MRPIGFFARFAVTFAVTLVLCANAAALGPTDWQQCVPPEAIPPWPEADMPLPPDDRNTVIEAATAQYLEKNRTIFEGDVSLRRGARWLGTPRLEYDETADRYVAAGEVHYQDDVLRFRAEHLEGKPGEDWARLQKVHFQVIDLAGSGNARQATMRGSIGILDDASYSACPPEHRQWELRGSRIRINRDEGVGTISNGTLYFGKVPVFYLPWASFPIDDRRRSGFLYPSLGRSSANGIDVLLPYYLNLAPNYDATLTARWLADRGVMWGSEFRFLTGTSGGTITATWLPNDSRLGHDRSLITLRQNTRLGDYWRFRTNLNSVSDDRYFEDFGDSLTAASTRLLASNAGLYGRGKYWDASLAIQLWDLTDPLLSDDFQPYRKLPQVRFNWERPLLGTRLIGGLRAEGVVFDHTTRADARRVDLRPYIEVPIEGAWWYVLPKFSYRLTAYDIDNRLANSTGAGDNNPIRSLPITSIDIGAFFERPLQLFGATMTNTLEPRLYYLNVPRSNQDDIPLLDTQELTFGYSQLFRDNRFTGADRQADANQLTFAVTSRLLQTHSGRELMVLTVGESLLFRPSQTVLPGRVPNPRDLSPLVVELKVNIDDRWTLSAAQHQDVDQGFTELSAFRLQYRFLDSGVANLSYRFRANELEQLDGSALIPVSASWRLLGRWNYSLRDKQTLESLVGFEWQSCCMAVRILGRRFIRTREGAATNSILLEFELRGLGSFGQRTGSLLERAILGYDR